MEYLFEVFPEWRGDVENVEETNDRILAGIRVSGHAAASGVSVDQLAWLVARMEDGMFIAMRFFRTEDEARAAAGHELSPGSNLGFRPGRAWCGRLPGDTGPMEVESVVRRAVEAFNLHQLEAQIELFDRNVEIVPLRAALEAIVYQGHDGLRRFDGDVDASWSERRVEILDLEVSGEQALAIGRLRLKGSASGAWVEQTVAWSVCVRNGRVMRLNLHQTPEDARRELGWKA
jgi:ketosteroid isomerase-like protein